MMEYSLSVCLSVCLSTLIKLFSGGHKVLIRNFPLSLILLANYQDSLKAIRLKCPLPKDVVTQVILLSMAALSSRTKCCGMGQLE